MSPSPLHPALAAAAQAIAPWQVPAPLAHLPEECLPGLEGTPDAGRLVGWRVRLNFGSARLLQYREQLLAQALRMETIAEMGGEEHLVWADIFVGDLRQSPSAELDARLALAQAMLADRGLA